jgi:hypothetical protein
MWETPDSFEKRKPVIQFLSIHRNVVEQLEGKPPNL